MERLILATDPGARRPPDTALYLGEDVLEFALGLGVRPPVRVGPEGYDLATAIGTRRL
jgi:hypothetical protein